MDSMCLRCARLTLRVNREHGSVAVRTIRSFSSTTTRYEDQPRESLASRQPRAGEASASQQGAQRGPILRRAPAEGAPRPSAQNGQVLQRSKPAPQGTLIRRTGGPARPGPNARRPAATPQAGQVLQRTGGMGPRRTGAPGQTTQGASAQRKTMNRRPRPANRPGEGGYDEDSGPTEAELDEYVTKHVDVPVNPTEPLVYKPLPQSDIELQKDWPNTPLSATGLAASVVQKIESLAGRIPHGYQTPGQLAEHFHKGKLTRFESEEEKELVIKIAQDLAKKRADTLTDRKGEQIQPEDMTLSDLGQSQGGKMLFNTVVKGDVPEAQKLNMPFLDSIVRNLRNNETYDQPHTEQFLAKIQSLMPNQGARRAAPAKKAA